jgi:hypothetical protein
VVERVSTDGAIAGLGLADPHVVAPLGEFPSISARALAAEPLYSAVANLAWLRQPLIRFRHQRTRSGRLGRIFAPLPPYRP